ncbi:MAG TPA: GNAT family N-acetyltransferase [Myxococcales bacterium]|nr:GNAT family N-acetyltransferase [Myxococcales bacterium]
MAESLRVRPATAADAAETAACQLTCYRAAYAHILPAERLQSPTLKKEFLEGRRQRYSTAPAIHLVLEGPDGSGGRAVLGFSDAGPLRPYPTLRPQVAAATEAAATLELWTLYVHPGLRGHGGGPLLFAGAVEALGQRHPDSPRLVVLTFEANAPARRRYERLGGRLFGTLYGYELWGRDYRVACYEWLPAAAAQRRT